MKYKLLLLLVMLSACSFASEEAQLQIVLKQQVYSDSGIPKPGRTARQGDHVVYEAAYQNTAHHQLASFTAKLPIPPRLSIIGAHYSFSSGKHGEISLPSTPPCALDDSKYVLCIIDGLLPGETFLLSARMIVSE